jgi:hypothetical protein
MSIGLKMYSMQVASDLTEWELSDVKSSDDVISVARKIYNFLSEGQSSEALNVVQFTPKDMN